MPVSKQTIREIAARSGISRVSQESADLLNGIVDRVLSISFPKDASVVLRNVLDRVSDIAGQNGLINVVLNKTVQSVSQESFPVPHDTVRRLIRVHAGDVKVPEITILTISHMIGHLLEELIVAANKLIPAGLDRKLEGKHIVELIAREQSLNRPPIGPLDKADRKSRKSKSKKSKSRKSKSKRSKKSKKSLRRRSRK
jgi:hypothetical protein